LQGIEEIQKEINDGTEIYSTTGVSKSFQQWQHGLSQCIAAHDEYS
jgi:hypothetical protein